jgi:transcriptional regulator with XRE-family HTH domain
MSLVAVGAYLQTLRDLHRIPRAEVAQGANTSESQILRIERGDQETRSSVLFSFNRIVEGDFDQLSQLLLQEDATLEDGVAAAKRWFTKGSVAPAPAPALSGSPVLTEQQRAGVELIINKLDVPALESFSSLLEACAAGSTQEAMYWLGYIRGRKSTAG